MGKKHDCVGRSSKLRPTPSHYTQHPTPHTLLFDATGTMRSLNFSTCILIWTYTTGTERSLFKHGLLSNYLIQQLKRPDVPMFIV
ncbi:hypothetical protein [Nostoc sp. UHCC 0251]|uniref:hypothetical protein n=1 Tax=Nostoc sp. UHCC 0251 TaxID=3110240 RepID=UPI002B203DF4|nr:hypothetical protein [Nostoc sp. UHCC 0251]MEA5623213.1 hypothetical protein [Nostoc sp. UHCC 0251]